MALGGPAVGGGMAPAAGGSVAPAAGGSYLWTQASQNWEGMTLVPEATALLWESGVRRDILFRVFIQLRVVVESQLICSFTSQMATTAKGGQGQGRVPGLRCTVQHAGLPWEDRHPRIWAVLCLNSILSFNYQVQCLPQTGTCVDWKV